MEEKKEKTRLIFRREDMFGPHQTVIFHLAPVLPLLLPSLFHQPKKKKERKECRAIEITTPWKMSKFVGRRKRPKDKVRVLGKLFTLFVIGKSFFSLLRKKRLRRKEKLSCLYKGKRVNPCQSGQCQMPHGCFYIFFLELLCACVVCSSGAFQYPPN